MATSDVDKNPLGSKKIFLPYHYNICQEIFSYFSELTQIFLYLFHGSFILKNLLRAARLCRQALSAVKQESQAVTAIGHTISQSIHNQSECKHGETFSVFVRNNRSASLRCLYNFLSYFRG